MIPLVNMIMYTCTCIDNHIATYPVLVTKNVCNFGHALNCNMHIFEIVYFQYEINIYIYIRVNNEPI